MCHRIVPDDFQSVHPRKHFFFSHISSRALKREYNFLFLFFFCHHIMFFILARVTQLSTIFYQSSACTLFCGGGVVRLPPPHPRGYSVSIFIVYAEVILHRYFWFFFSLSHTRTLLCKVTPPLSNLLQLPETLWLQLNMLSTK